MNIIKTIGVVGAGQMGNGIAHVSALAGYDVMLADANASAIDKAMQTIEYNLGRQVHREAITEAQAKTALGRIKKTPSMKDVAGADLVIESATEREDVKRAIFAELQAHLRADSLLASNTSSISITRLAAGTDRPDKFIGIHFMNPVPVMKLVELIRGLATSQETYERALQ